MSTISKFRTGLFAAVLAALSFAPAVHAQDIAKMNVPFAFETGSGHHFAAGVYTVRLDDPYNLIIRSDSDSAIMMTSVQDDSRTPSRGEAVFHRYGSQYFLSELRIGGSTRRLYFHPSKKEKQLQIAADKTAPATEELALVKAQR
jgi:hypothetical protein